MRPRCLRGLPKPEKSEGSFFSAQLTMEKPGYRGYSEDVRNVICTWRLAAFCPECVKTLMELIVVEQ